MDDYIQNDYGGPHMPGLMKMVFHPYRLSLDGWRGQLDECCGQRIVLGDYGDYSNGNFNQTGNIFEDMWIAGIDSTNSAYHPRVSRVSSYLRLSNCMENWIDLALAYHDEEKHLVLCQPKSLQLPVNEHFVLLLKALSTCAAGKHLVVTVIQCSDFYRVDDNGE
ncbi:hypothetical protein BKA82DRAFT_768887 [Pisolithus tinctorius]|uniref:Uncharacterized protein n=1 Tax=Pisolithus tinctorius Marx 270 TaxID=870435 RepID=A0A0C3JS60_PISTI|nr:hypothetical protein BKA82DRAFT_768887 [Pisolithus tinctorius]KIO00312.1 hypothetical protein M404DRAFT_768887 [Pisolithus tinctorius Marx 270]